MAVEGELKDISLTGLVQVVCLERRTGELVIARRGEEGVIFFEKGEIVHAKSGNLIGEEALFHMLSWHDGSFRINDKVTVMTKTIAINWNHLLMEGMRRIDERKWEMETPPMGEIPTVLSEADIERDTILRDDLFLLIAKLEQWIPKFSEKKTQKYPYLALELLTDIVNQVIDTVENSHMGNSHAISLKDVFIKVNDKYPQARVLYIKDKNRLSIKTAVNLYTSWNSDVADRKHMFRLISHAILEILDFYLALLIKGLHLTNIREEMQETASIFIVDLKRAVDMVNF